MAESVHPSLGARASRIASNLLARNSHPLRHRTLDGLVFDIVPSAAVDLAIATERCEPAILREVATLLSAGDWAIDLGANVGGVTLRMASRVGEVGHVLAYEPNPTVAQQLRHNLNVNELNNVTVVQAAAGERSGDATLYVPNHQNSGTASLFDRESNVGGPSVVVTTEAVDERWRNVGCPWVRLVKLDIQGGEFAALRGMKQMLTQCRPAIIVEATPNTAAAAGWRFADLGQLVKSLDYSYATIVALGNSPHCRIERVAAGDYDGISGDVLFL